MSLLPCCCRDSTLSSPLHSSIILHTCSSTFLLPAISSDGGGREGDEDEGERSGSVMVHTLSKSREHREFAENLFAPTTIGTIDYILEQDNQLFLLFL